MAEEDLVASCTGACCMFESVMPCMLFDRVVGAVILPRARTRPVGLELRQSACSAPSGSPLPMKRASWRGGDRQLSVSGPRSPGR